jgi:hypothetical protein
MSQWQESDLKKRQDIADRQLQEWRVRALYWPVFREGRYVMIGDVQALRWVHACRKCSQAIWFDYDPDGNEYKYSEAEKLALIVAHIRQNHERDFDDEDREPEVLDSTGSGNTGYISGGDAYRSRDQGIDSGRIGETPHSDREQA